MKYCATVVKVGCITVEATSESEAFEIANLAKSDDVRWADELIATDVEPICEDGEE